MRSLGDRGALISSVSDLMYLALAKRLGTRGVTADQRFVNALPTTDHSDLVLLVTNTTDDGQQSSVTATADFLPDLRPRRWTPLAGHSLRPAGLFIGKETSAMDVVVLPSFQDNRPCLYSRTLDAGVRHRDPTEGHAHGC